MGFKENLKEIARVKKAENTEIVISRGKHEGAEFVDIREFAVGEGYSGPTKKGVRIPITIFPDVLEKLIDAS